MDVFGAVAIMFAVAVVQKNVNTSVVGLLHFKDMQIFYNQNEPFLWP